MGHYLIIGADQGIGLALLNRIKAEQSFFPVLHTTRRKNGDGIFLDLSSPPHKLGVTEDVTCVFFCAAISNFTACEKNKKSTKKINVEGTLAVAKQLLDKNCFIIFLSSSAVFDGSTHWPNEGAKCNPTTEYGKQKLLAEELLLKMDNGRNRVAIVRLTKILTDHTPVVKKFIDGIRLGGSVQAFSDLKFAPITMPYVVDALLQIASREIGGVFHLSGCDELHYADFARKLAIQMDGNPDRIKNLHSNDLGILFKPTYPGLGMDRTKKLLNLTTISSHDVIQQIVSTHSSQA